MLTLNLDLLNFDLDHETLTLTFDLGFDLVCNFIFIFVRVKRDPSQDITDPLVLEALQQTEHVYEEFYRKCRGVF